jgi:hypothetical protein
MLELVVASRHEGTDDDVDDEQHYDQRAAHARSLPLVSVPPDRLRSASPHEVDDRHHDEDDHEDADDPDPSDSG